MFGFSASISVQFDTPFAPFPGCQWEKGLQWVKDSGLQAAELIVCDPGSVDLKAVKDKLDALELPVSTISTGQAVSREGLIMTSPDPAIRSATRRRLQEDIDFSVSLGCPNVTIGLIRGGISSGNPEEEYGYLKEELLRVVDYAVKKGIVLNLEPINRYECSLLNSTASAWQLIDEIKAQDSVGILYDTFHSNIEDADMIGTVRKYARYFSNVHFADSNRQLPGEGHTDFAAIVDALKECGYERYVALEVLNRPDADHIRTFAGQRIRDLRAEGK